MSPDNVCAISTGLSGDDTKFCGIYKGVSLVSTEDMVLNYIYVLVDPEIIITIIMKLSDMNKNDLTCAHGEGRMACQVRVIWGSLVVNKSFHFAFKYSMYQQYF